MSAEAKFKIGELVWHATFDDREKWVACPECLGHKFAKVTFGDGKEAMVDCGLCAVGFEPPRGTVRTYEHEPRAELTRVESISISPQYGDGTAYEVRYSLSDHRSSYEPDVFDNEEDAKVRAIQLAQEWEAKENERLSVKDKPSKTWSQNASYHRQALKRSERDVEYHTQKLNAAKAHSKEAQ